MNLDESLFQTAASSLAWRRFVRYIRILLNHPFMQIRTLDPDKQQLNLFYISYIKMKCFIF